MKALIGGWRGAWGQGEFPFYFVQLAPYSKNDGRLPLIWEAQLESLTIPNTGMAVTTDLIASDRLGNHHPKQKREVGRRLALWALAGPYGRKDLVRSGPLYKSLTVEGGEARVGFDHTGGGLAARDGAALTHFQVAGADRKFVKAEAEIEGREVVVRSDAVPAPVAVRFGWHQEAQPNLVNREGLPASPFRTDDW
jgi:sialate O-acetylesterase